ncbi:hypothetical protein [Clostridium saudiense]|uniref:hypothetical protein n=1 Tax=Clostridium saudiense TaxID=1414720 RepID=UPI0004AFBA0F|nr:hypothetical protein [Clostridium saudiense]
MNRAERRAREKEKKKDSNKKVEALAWLRSLPPAKQILIDSLVKIEAKKENNNLLQAIDRCFSAAVFEELENLEWEDVKRIIDKSAELMLDDAHKMKNLKESLGGSYDMAIKKINEEMAPEVEKRVRELIKDGYNQKVSVKMLIEEFNTLSTAMLTNTYKKTKAIIKDEENIKKISEKKESAENVNKIKDAMGEPDKEVADALEYIFEDELKENLNNKKGIDENKDEIQEKEIKNSKLKIVKEITKVIEREVQGEYGLYNIKGSVVTVDEEFAFSSAKDVNCWASAERENLLKQIEEIKSKINHINSCEHEAIEVIETFMNI